MRFRYLRIAFTATCLFTCVLVIALWVRSNTYFDSTRGVVFPSWRGWIFSWHGRVYAHENYHMSAASAEDFEMSTNFLGGATVCGCFVEPAGSGISLAYWYFVVPLVAMAASPWLRFRYSLRTLLIATTLVAVGLGLAVYMIGK